MSELAKHATRQTATPKGLSFNHRQADRFSFVPFLLPALMFYVVFVLYPIANALVLSFYRWDGMSANREFVGLRNYIFVLTQDSVFWRALTNSGLWMIASLIVPTSLGLGLAVAVNTPLLGRTLFRTIFYVPAVLATVVVAIMWSWMYHPTLGLVNALLQAVGLGTQDWLGNPRIALWSAFIASVWSTTGSNMLLFLAGLQRVPGDLVEAAKVDGANDWRIFWHVTLPSLRQTIIYVVALTIIGSLKVFDLVYAMTYGGPAQSSQVLATWSYFQAFNFHNFGIGMAVACILFAIALVIIVPFIRWVTRRETT